MRQDAAGSRTVYLYGDLEHSFRVTGSVTDGVLTEYVYDDSGLLVAVRRGGAWFTVLTDVVGSPRAVVDGTGAVVASWTYSPFGELVSTTGTFEMAVGYGAGIPDPAHPLVRMGLRDYDPAAGRFTTPDPVLLDGGEPNLYRYAQNMPTSLADPAGTDSVGFQFCGAACGEISLSCGPRGCQLCVGAGVGFGGGFSYDPAASPGGDFYGKLGCGSGPLEIATNCETVLCYQGPELYAVVCKPDMNLNLAGLSMELGCSATVGTCFS